MFLFFLTGGVIRQISHRNNSTRSRLTDTLFTPTSASAPNGENFFDFSSTGGAQQTSSTNRNAIQQTVGGTSSRDRKHRLRSQSEEHKKVSCFLIFFIKVFLCYGIMKATEYVSIINSAR